MDFLEIDYFVIYVWYIYLIITLEFIQLGNGVEKNRRVCCKFGKLRQLNKPVC